MKPTSQAMQATDADRIEEAIRLALQLSESEYSEASLSAAIHLTHLGRAALPQIHATLIEGDTPRLQPWEKDSWSGRGDEEPRPKRRAAHDQALLTAIGAIADPTSVPTLKAFLQDQPRGTDDTPNRSPRYTMFASGGTGPYERRSLAPLALTALSKIKTSEALGVFLERVWHLEEYKPVLFAGIQRFGGAGERALLEVSQGADEERAAVAMAMLAALGNTDAVKPALKTLASGEGSRLESAVLVLQRTKPAESVEAVEAFLEEGLKQGADPDGREDGWSRRNRETNEWRGQDVLRKVIVLYADLVKHESVPLLLRYAAAERIERGRAMGTTSKAILGIGSDALPALLNRAQNADAAVSRAAIELASRLKKGPEDGRFPEHW